MSEKHVLDRFRNSWFFTDVLVPFLVTRALLVFVGMLVQVLGFPISPDYPITSVMVDRWSFTPNLLIDMWMRWDSGWYFSLAKLGYTGLENLGTTYSSLAFHPMYSGLIRVLLGLIGAPITETSFGLVGILVSNLSLLAGLAGLRLLTIEAIGKQSAGRQSVWWALVFPASFFFSTVYTESIWFAFTVFCLLAAWQKRWALAGVLAMCAVLTRANGILVMVPLGWMYMTGRGWDFRRLDWQILWLAVPPLALAVWYALWYPITGYLAAPIVAQKGWSRTFSWPWRALFFPTVDLGLITRFEQIFLIIALLVTTWALWKGITRSPGAIPLEFSLFSLILLVFPLFSGNTYSALRFGIETFPLFIIAAGWQGNRRLRIGLMALLFLFQLYLFGRWCLFYWVG